MLGEPPTTGMQLSTMIATLLSIQVTRPRNYGRNEAADDHDKAWRTAFFKEPVSGRVQVGQTNLAGDEQADRENHGGIDKAVLAYSADHYSYWREVLHKPEIPFGGFGENLTIAGLDETKVCLGDIWRIGDVRFEVSQPRQPCWKLSRRWRIDDLARQVKANLKSGWYLRVLQTGEIEAGMAVTLEDRPLPEWTVARASDVLYHRKDDLQAAEELSRLPQLSLAWREIFLERLSK
jgi:MOSC domain-containing protein YiiM